jgi:hypothetical protein
MYFLPRKLTSLRLIQGRHRHSCPVLFVSQPPHISCRIHDYSQAGCLHLYRKSSSKLATTVSRPLSAIVAARGSDVGIVVDFSLEASRGHVRFNDHLNLIDKNIAFCTQIQMLGEPQKAFSRKCPGLPRTADSHTSSHWSCSRSLRPNALGQNSGQSLVHSSLTHTYTASPAPHPSEPDCPSQSHHSLAHGAHAPTDRARHAD